jgi:hypothetical protein
MSAKLSVTSLAAVVILGGATAASAASISWTSQYVPETASTNTDATWYSVLSTSGSLVVAENSGSAAINIDFNNDTVTDIPFGSGTFTFGNSHVGFYNSAASNDLINSGSWAGGGAGTLPLTVVSGNQYQVQLLIADARNLGAASIRTVSVDGTTPVVYNYFAPANPSWGFRLYTGTFTADSTTQNVSIQTFNADTASAGPQLNAFQLRDVTPVPEPGVSGLILLSALGLGRSRRRK